MRRTLGWIGGLLIGAAASLVAQPLAPAGAGPEGAWGGNRARLIVSATDVRLQIECLGGHVEAPIALDRRGFFRLEMRLAPMRGVQIEGDHDDAPLAEISGTIANDRLQLTVGPAGRVGAGTYQLTRGGKATLPNCRFRS